MLVAGKGKRRKESCILCTRKFPGSQRLEFDARSDNPAPCDLSAFIGANELGLATGYFFGFGSEWNTYSRLLVQGPPVKEYDAVITPGTLHHVVCQREGNTLTHIVDGEVVMTYVHDTPLKGAAHEMVGFYIYSSGKIDNVKLYTKPEN